MSNFTETSVRIGSFAVVFALLAAWELMAPRRRIPLRQAPRWANNIALVALNTLLLRLVTPLGAVGAAVLAEQHGWGLLNAVDVPPWAAVLASVLVLDLAIYGQHVMLHRVPLLWRLHLVHHADLAIDVTTGLRFHTAEILLSLGIKAAVILALGAPALGVLIFEVLLNATSMFNHSNVAMPASVDRWLRRAVVTPDMHRVHHSWHRRETNSNFGFNLPWWDWLFGTYRDQPADGHEGMTIGLHEIRDEHRAERLHWMLWLPFVRLPARRYADEDMENSK